MQRLIASLFIGLFGLAGLSLVGVEILVHAYPPVPWNWGDSIVALIGLTIACIGGYGMHAVLHSSRRGA